MRRSPTAAFTLIEMMTVIAVIVILTGLVLNIAGYANRKGALARAEGEIQMISSACESYKADNGNYPRDVPDSGSGSVTDLLSPKHDFSPVASVYTNASLFLYKELSGDKTGASGAGLPDGVPDANEPRYFKELDMRILNTKKDATTKAIIQVNYIQDPFGFAYGYSTAAASIEQNFQRDLKLGTANPKRKTGDALRGFNTGSFDLWSTGGDNTTSSPGSDANKALKWAKWVKNW